MTPSKLVLLLSLAAPVFGQAPLKFEVATIRPAGPPDAAANLIVIERSRSLYLLQMTLRDLIYFAYGTWHSTDIWVSGGPDWINQTRYDVLARAENNTPERQFRAMLQTLLEEHFALKVHRETQTIDVYALVPARSDGKLRPKVEAWDGTCGDGRTPSGDDPRCVEVFRPPGMFLEGVTMLSVAEMLSTQRQVLDRVVEDRTGLTGRYKMELEFQFTPQVPDGPSIFTAVQEQLGLNLEPAKSSWEVVVVESAQPPAEN